VRSRPPNLPWRGRESRGSAAALISVGGGMVNASFPVFPSAGPRRSPVQKFVRAPPKTIPDDPADFESNWELEIQLGVCL